MEGELICCCDACGWTRVIGGFQHIISFIATVGCIKLTATRVIAWENVDKAKHADGSPLSPEEIQALKTTLNIAIGGSVVFLILAILALVMSTVLLRGSYTRNPRCLGAWLVYTVICLIAWTLNVLVMSIVLGSEREIVLSLVSLALGFVIQGFCWWIVRTHKREIQGVAYTRNS